MLKRLLIIATFSFLIIGCGSSGDTEIAKETPKAEEKAKTEEKPAEENKPEENKENNEVINDPGEFLKIAQSRSPSTPKDYDAKIGDKVLALSSANSWYTGEVKEIEGDKITVAWDEKMAPRPIDADKVLPLPNTELPEANQFVLMEHVKGTRWDFGQALKINGNEIEVRDLNGKTRMLNVSKVIPLN